MNIPNEHISDELLNAYVDGELGAEDTARIDAAMGRDDILRKRVNDLSKVSALIRAAFEDNSPSLQQVPPRAKASSVDVIWRIAATIAFVSIGVLFSLHLYDHHLTTQTPQATVAATDSSTRIQDQAAVKGKTFKVMFHVGREDAELLNNVLGETDRLLSHSTELNRPVSIRVIASHGGLALLNGASEQNAQRVREIKRQYQNQVDFVGCGETLEQWANKNPGEDPDLLPEMLMVDSGVLELLRLQQKGWTLVAI